MNIHSTNTNKQFVFLSSVLPNVKRFFVIISKADRCEQLALQLRDLEARSQSLQMTVDRLNEALAKSEEGEDVHKNRVCTALQ